MCFGLTDEDGVFNDDTKICNTANRVKNSLIVFEKNEKKHAYFGIQIHGPQTNENIIIQITTEPKEKSSTAPKVLFPVGAVLVIVAIVVAVVVIKKKRARNEESYNAIGRNA